MSTQTLTPRILGQAENAHRALLERLLVGTDLTYQRWGALTLVAASNQITEIDLVDRLVANLKIDREAAGIVVADMVTIGLLRARDGHLDFTEAGRDLYMRIRAVADATVTELYGDSPAADREVAARVLMEITVRVNAKLDALNQNTARAHGV